MTDQEFEALFDRLMTSRREEMRTRFNRVLPTGELIFNRFEKAPYLHAGHESSVYDTSVVMGDVQIGSHVWVGPYTLLDGSSAPLKIGNYVSVDTGVTIYTHDSTRHYVSGGINPFEHGPVTIGDCTVLGTMSMVCCNVSIGSHCVVAAHSFVRSSSWRIRCSPPLLPWILRKPPSCATSFSPSGATRPWTSISPPDGAGKRCARRNGDKGGRKSGN